MRSEYPDLFKVGSRKASNTRSNRKNSQNMKSPIKFRNHTYRNNPEIEEGNS